VKKGLFVRKKSLSKSLRTKTKLISVICEEVADEDWPNQYCGSVDQKPSSGKKCTVRIAENADSVEELVLSQESTSGTHKTICQIEQKTGISKTSVRWRLWIETKTAVL